MTTHNFDWLSYLEVAGHLRLQAGEGYHRSAASRAYYGVFGHIRQVLFATRRGSHIRVINALKNDPRPDVSTLGEDLEHLRDERNFADYQADTPYSDSQADDALAQARSIRDRALNLLR